MGNIETSLAATTRKELMVMTTVSSRKLEQFVGGIDEAFESRRLRLHLC